jgi:uncharacterized integral membrane protein
MTSGPARDTRLAGQNTAATADQARSGETPAHLVVRRTRFGGIWVAFARFALVLLLFFVLDNDKSVTIGYFGAHEHVPLGVALLLAAVFGVLLVVIPGTARIIQLRMVAHRHRRQDAETAASSSARPASDAAFPGQAHRAR